MDWFDVPVEIDGKAASLIAQGMRKVASADGHLHEREMNLIAAFEAELPEKSGDAESITLTDDGVRLAYVRSLIMVALADGRITSPEEKVIADLAGEQGFERGEVHTMILDVKRSFLSTFAGVHVFRDSVVRVAEDMGLPASEVDALRGQL